MTMLVAPLYGLVPPWGLFAALIGMANASLFFLLAGRSLGRLPLYVLSGAAVGLLAQPLGVLLADGGQAPLSIGEVSLPLISIAVWMALGVARALRV
jgi:hypothetical protein